MARAIQHEIDHLDGILFLDHLSLLKRQLLLARWQKEHKDDRSFIKEVHAGAGQAGVMRIVFFGTPEFAVPSLEALLARAVQVVRRRHPAGQAAGPLPLDAGAAAGQAGGGARRASRCCSPTARRATSSSPRSAALEPELGVVVAYGHILRPDVLVAPHARHDQRACLAAAALARRRADPVGHPGRRSRDRHQHHADGGGTGHRTGAAPDRHPASATAKRRARSPSRLADARRRSAGGGAARCSPADRAARAPGLDATSPSRPRSIGQRAARLDAASADAVARQVRAFDPAPGAWTTLGDAPVKLFGAARLTRRRRAPGEVLAAGAGSWSRYRTRRGRGRRGAAGRARTRMPVRDWVRGRGIAAGDQLRMRPLPRLLAVTDADVLAARRFRCPRGGDRSGRARRWRSMRATAPPDGAAADAAQPRGCSRSRAPPRPPSFVNGRPDSPRALGAAGRAARAGRTSRPPTRAGCCPPDGSAARCTPMARPRAAVDRGRRLPPRRQRLRDARRIPVARPGRPRPRPSRGGARPAGDRDRRHRRRPGRQAVREAGAWGVAAIAALWRRARSGRGGARPAARPGRRTRERAGRSPSTARPAGCRGPVDAARPARGTSSSIRARSWSSSIARSSAERGWRRRCWRQETPSSWCTSSEAGEPGGDYLSLCPDWIPRSRNDRHHRPRHRDRRPAGHRRPELPLAAHGRHRQVPQQRRDGRAIEASGAEIVTVAVRRVDLDRTQGGGRPPSPEPRQYFLLANTAGCYSADEAIRYARLAPRGGVQRLREARGHRRPGDAAARRRRPARGGARAGRRRASRCWPTPTTT